MAPVYRNIVVVYDDAGTGDAALCRGAELARLCKARLHLLGIVVTEGGLMLDPAIVSLDLLETERFYLQEALGEAVGHLDRQGVTAMTCIRDGDAAREIIAFAAEVDADLVIIGHSAKGLLARWIEGSVGAHLLDDLPCSLLVAKDKVLPDQPEC